MDHDLDCMLVLVEMRRPENASELQQFPLGLRHSSRTERMVSRSAFRTKSGRRNGCGYGIRCMNLWYSRYGKTILSLSGQC